MSFPKPQLFKKDYQHLSRMMKAFCHPARLQILKDLSAEGSMYVNEINEKMPLGRPAVSDHLRTLRHCGLVQVEEYGRYNIYTVDQDNLQEVENHLSRFINTVLV